MARPTKYTPATVEKLMRAIKSGATYELAAKYAGIGESTLYEWMAKKPDLVQRLAEAEGEAAMIWLAKIELAASAGNWQAAAWKLERRYPAMYGRIVQQQEHSGSVQVNHGLSFQSDDDEAASLARNLVRRLSGGSVPDPSGPGPAGQ